MRQRPVDDASSRLLQTLQDNPALPALLRSLQPAALARLVDRIGLNDAGEVMALAPTQKLLQALDEALWKSPQPGVTEVFDSRELVDWLESWNEIGDEFVAERLAAMSDDYRALCLSHLVSVRIHHTLAFLAIPDDEVDRERDTLQPIGTCAFYGPYMVVPVVEDEWEIVRAALDALATERHECLMHTLGMLDGAESMLATPERRRQLQIDLAHERERARENVGYVTATGASAFLVYVATARIEELAALSVYDEETRRHLAAFGASDVEDPEDDEADESPQEPPTVEQMQQLRTVLEREELLIPQSTLLLTDQRTRKHHALTQALSELAETDPPAFERCARELAYLANVLKVGVSVKGEPMSDVDARDAAYAACDQGLELAREHGLDTRVAQEPGLIRLFALGWRAQRELSRAPRSKRER
ncbi:MAG TPA: DUF6178 family protein [Steroidobacteraceae bacterium]|jgi:hypothetical protein|nr:DUF6178 family protein [Steroidobacteraceae bacterium]